MTRAIWIDFLKEKTEEQEQLTEEEVSDIYQDSQIEDEGKEHQYSKGITVTYEGTEYGDDAQPLLEGDFKDE